MKKVLFFAVLLLIAASSCTKEEPTVVASTNNEVKEMMDVLKKSGINPNDVKVNEKLRCFVVEGDITIDFGDIPKIREALNKNAGSFKAYQYPNPYYATFQAVSSIDVYVDPSVGTNGWQSAVNAAISAWNTISPYSGVKISLVNNPASADLKISTYFEDSEIAALGNGCINGVVGKYIKINSNHNFLDESIKINTIAHEIGHTIGIAHTNGQSTFCTPILIPETSGSNDPNAVMYPITHVWNGFSVDEVKGILYLYRNNRLRGGISGNYPEYCWSMRECTYSGSASGGVAPIRYSWKSYVGSTLLDQSNSEIFNTSMPAYKDLKVVLTITSSDGQSVTSEVTTRNLDAGRLPDPR